MLDRMMLDDFKRTPYWKKVRRIALANQIGYWIGGEPSGSVGLDNSPEGNDSAYTSVTLGQAGIGDGRSCPLYDGSASFNNIFSAALDADFNGAEGSLAVWSRVRNVGVWTDGSVRAFVHIRTDASNLLYIVKSGNNTVQYAYIAGGVTESQDLTISDTGWNVYSMSWSALADEVRYYHNGTVVGLTDTGLGTYNGGLNSAQCNIGARFTTPTWVFDGRIAHAALWTTPLTAAQHARLNFPL